MLRRAFLKTTIATGLSLAATACGRRSRPDGWVFLGERTVKFSGERDAIPVTAAKGAFKRIRLRVRDNGVFFADLKVHFANGETHDVSLRTFIAKGDQTRVIDLPGKARIISRVTMVYRSNPKHGVRKGRARVRLFGKQA